MIKLRNLLIHSLTLFAFTILLQAAEQPLGERKVLALTIHGDVEYSRDGKKFEKLRAGNTIPAGSIVRTGKGAKADLFLRRIGTMIRMTPESEVSFDKLAMFMKNGVIVKETQLDLRAGRLITFVRVLIPDSRFEVKTVNGKALVQGAGTGRYDLRADGTIITGKSSRSPIKVINDQGTTVIEPGQKFNVKERKVNPMIPADTEMLLIELDELEHLAQELTPPPSPEELPAKK